MTTESRDSVVTGGIIASMGDVEVCGAGHEVIWGSLDTLAERTAWDREHRACVRPAPPPRVEGPSAESCALAARLSGAGFDVEPYGDACVIGVVARVESEAVKVAVMLRTAGRVVVRTSGIVILGGRPAAWIPSR